MRRGAKVAAIGAAALIAAGIGAKEYSKINNPDLVGRQKFWTLNSKSMNFYRGKVSAETQAGESKYRTTRSLLRAGLSVYEIREGERKVGELKKNLKIAGKNYTLQATNEVVETISRTPKVYPARANWKLTKQGKPFLLITETGPSAWLPGIHKFNLVDPVTGNKIGELSAQFDFKRFVIGRRDYAMRLEPEYKGHLNPLEAMGVLTTIGKLESWYLFKGGGSKSSAPKK